MKCTPSIIKASQKIGIVLGLLLWSLLPSTLFAQQLMETIEVDSVTRSPKKNLPYHMPFVLKVPVSDEPNQVRLYKHRRQSNQADMDLRSFINHERVNKRHYLTDNTYESAIQEPKERALRSLDEISRAYYQSPNPEIQDNTIESTGDAIQNYLMSIRRNHRIKPQMRWHIKIAKIKTKRAMRFLKREPKTKDFIAYRKIEKARLAIDRIGLDNNYVVIPEKNIQLVNEKNQKYVLVKFGDIAGDPTFSQHLYLDPNYNYSLYFETSVRGYQKLLDLYRTCQIESSRCAEYTEALNSSTAESNYAAIPASTVEQHYNLVRNDYNNLDDQLSKIASSPSFENSTVDCLMQLHLHDQCCEYEEEVKKQITFLNNMANWLEKREQDDLVHGLLNFDTGKSLEKYDISGRMSSLEQLDKKIQSFQEADQLYHFFPQNSSCVDEFIPALRDSIQQNLENLKTAKKNRSEITEAIDNEAPMISYDSMNESSNITTNLFSFDSRTSSHIVADFGFGYFGAIGNDERRKLFSGITPYLGFSVSPWPFNKSMPFRMYPRHIKRNLVKRLAFNVGWTTTKLSRDETTRDFFESGSLILGVSFHLNHAIKLTYGRTLFYEENINPLVEKRSLTSTAFIGLTIDISIKNAFNTLSSLVTSRTR